MLFFHSPQKKITDKMALYIATKPVRNDSNIKYLAVRFDSNLNWEKHIYELSKKFSRGLGIL